MNDMKELVTEEQCNQIILLLSIAVTLGALGYGFFRNSKVEKSQKKFFWANVSLSALLGPAIWGFWEIYNSIENFYGLDSLKALKYNFFIVVVLAVVFVGLFHFIPRWLQGKPALKRRR